MDKNMIAMMTKDEMERTNCDFLTALHRTYQVCALIAQCAGVEASVIHFTERYLAVEKEMAK